MSKYIASVSYEGTFEGDAVRAVFRPLSFEDALIIEDIEVMPVSDDLKDKVAAQIREQVEVAKVMSKYLPSYAISFTGLKDSSGADIGIDEVCSVAYFASLIVDMGRALVRAAYPENPKKPAGTSVS